MWVKRGSQRVIALWKGRGSYPSAAPAVVLVNMNILVNICCVYNAIKYDIRYQHFDLRRFEG
jgi:hypothetical protein